MTKIDLITYSRTRNYGGILQAYGLYRYLELKGYDIRFIDYIPARCNIKNRKVFVDEATALSKIWGRNAITKFLFSIFRYSSSKKSFEPFLDFMNSRVKFTKEYFSIQELENDIPKADIYLTGSDQVWNSQFLREKGLDMPFYLSFVNNCKKMSYASSFGKDSIPDENKKEVQELISQYSAVSVREKSGKILLEKLGIKAEVVVDPTILCPEVEWKRISSPRKIKEYVFLYQVNFNKEMYIMAKKIAKKEGKKLIVVCLNKIKKYKIPEIKMNVSIEDWLSFIQYADCVITDSFHACVFSIIFSTKFLVNTSTRKGMATRIDNLLEMLNLTNVYMDSCSEKENINKLKKPIKWEKVHEILNEMRMKSEKWLEESIENNKFCS